jgi:subtilase family serine protease
MFTLDSDGMTLDFILTRLPLVPQQPDLVVSAVSKPPLRPGTHDVTFKSTVKNMGTLAAGESQMGIYLSPEPRYDMGRSVPLGSAPVPDLDVGASATVSSKVKVTIPEDASADSVYYVVVQADWTEDRAGVMQELNENNNDKARRLELRLPDLVVSAVSGPVLRPGTRDVTFKSTVKNRGTLAAGESQLGVYLSPVPFYDLGRSVLLGSTPVPGLGVGASATVSSKVKVTIPEDASADSVYYVVVQADWTEDRTGVMQELREDNNVKARKLTVRSK